jgi:hypothetical protein
VLVEPRAERGVDRLMTDTEYWMETGDIQDVIGKGCTIHQDNNGAVTSRNL